MAIEINTTAFINDSKQLDFGWVLKCAHAHRYKTDEGDWSTASTTYIDVIVKNAKVMEFQELVQAKSGSRVRLEGYGKPVAFVKKNGTAGSTLQMEPTAFEILKSGEDEEAPF